MNFGAQINKKDLITIVLLSIVFFSIATWNLGATQIPTNTTTLTAGESFYVNLGTSTNVQSMIVLIDLGGFNFTVSSGSPGNWQEANNVVFPTSSSGAEPYYSWEQISVGKTTQYLKVDVGPAVFETLIAQIAVINQNNQQVNITSITNVGTGNPYLNNLINQQNLVQYPSDYTQNTYFDEIYFVRTAQQYIDWQSHVTPYEWTHPPLGKLIQASGILVFGFNPFGWRIMGVIFATLMIPLIYLLGKKLFGTWIGGFTSAFLLTFDFMHFTMARMGTADTYVVFFSLASQLFFLIYLKNVLDKGWKTSIIPLFLATMFAFLGISTKWLVLFGFLGALAILVVMRLVEVKNFKGNLTAKFYALLDRPYSQLVAFLLIGIGIYLLIYIPDMLTGRTFLGVLQLQDQMYIYQSTLKATHPFASPWYSWPFLFDPINKWVPYAMSQYPNMVHVPLFLEVASLPNGTTSVIVLLGNPALWWFGFAVIVGLAIFTIPKFFKKNFSLRKNLPAVFILTFVAFQWFPYIFISRAVFIYHFYVNVPFLCLGSAFVINRYWANKWAKILTIAYFALVVGLFVLFYPVISGAPTTTNIINSLKWFGSWSF
jgi:dolichyl-phosphate-mannose--protein O-mannosyl transferase